VNLIFLAKNDPELNPATREYLESADLELSRVAHLARQTLGFYRDTAHAAPLRISEICDDVLDIYSRKLQSKSVAARKEYIGETEIMAIAGEMRQLFSNLLANAIDAVPKGGQLILRISPANWNTGQKGVRVTIADNGCGVGQQQMAKIFDPFFTTKEEFGVGLGLWLVHSIVIKHGGSIRVRSSVQPGRSGTAISVFLPQATAESKSAKVA